ncbi:hypothetical protein ABTH79_19885, partial [Acinetobacter baumannii]
NLPAALPLAPDFGAFWVTWRSRSEVGQFHPRIALAAACLAVVLVGVGLPTTPARAQCVPDPASNGQTVTCSGTDAN